ncbi:TIR-like protein FxsC [Kitasatospora sp. NPDC127116]|uniref:TIR-like protein FxsC n=1 Tax=Kitasatospora sp. NPDC127116 TaxID=3345367 RepID=UPI00363393AC
MSSSEGGPEEPAEPPGAAAPTGLTGLAAVLARASGHHPSPTELAELLWLACHSSPGSGRRSPGSATGQGASGEADHLPAPADGRAPSPLHAREPATADPRPATEAAPHLSLRTPAPPLLGRPLPLQRALRPLARRVPTTRGWELDEIRTVHRIAAHDAMPRFWLPVLRRTTEPWLDLVIAFDDGPTMTVWRPLARELHQLAAQTGFFRTVRLLRVPPTGTPLRLRIPTARPDRTALLVVSDCAGPQWWASEGTAGPWHRALRDRAAAMPTAVVQPLPERMWRRTALPATAGLFSAPGEAAPNASLAFTPYREDGVEQGTPIPVLEPTDGWLAHWAQLVAGRTGRVPGAAGRLRPTGPAAPASEDPDDLSAQDLVLRFRAVASPEAFRLAGHLAVGVPNLPVMRLVQAAVEPRPRPQQLAELVLSGMLTALPGADGHYAFRPGVREVLLRTLPRSAAWQTVDLLHRVGGYIEQHAGSAGETFPALTPGSGPGAAPERPAFALVSPDALALLSGGQPAPAAPPRPPAATPPPTRRRSAPLRNTALPPGRDRASGGAQRPYFFFSYARRDFEAEDAFVDQFFLDLRNELGRLLGVDGPVEDLAFRDTEQLRLGDDWAERLATMLGRSRTMVALYSPAYFASLYCGKEWTAFRGRVRRHHEETGAQVPALIPVLWEPVEQRDLAGEVNKVQWAQPDMGEAYARYGLRALLRSGQAGVYEQVVRVVAERVRDAAARRLGELPEFDLGAVRGYFPPPAAPPAASDPGRVRLFIAAGRASEAVSADGGWYGSKPWHWAPYHPPTRPSLAARAQQVITGAGYTTTLEEIDDDLNEKLDQAREDNQVSVLLVDPWVVGHERYRSALRAFDEHNHPVTGVIVPNGTGDPADGPERDALWAGVREVFRRNWPRRADAEHLFRTGVNQESFDNDLIIMVTIAQNKLMDDSFDWEDDGGDAFGLGPGGGPDLPPGMAVPSGPPPTHRALPPTRQVGPRPALPGSYPPPVSDRNADQD